MPDQGKTVMYRSLDKAVVELFTWGILIWKEFKGAPKKANVLNFAMFVLFLIGLGIIIKAGA